MSNTLSEQNLEKQFDDILKEAEEKAKKDLGIKCPYAFKSDVSGRIFVF